MVSRLSSSSSLTQRLHGIVAQLPGVVRILFSAWLALAGCSCEWVSRWLSRFCCTRSGLWHTLASTSHWWGRSHLLGSSVSQSMQRVWREGLLFLFLFLQKHKFCITLDYERRSLTSAWALAVVTIGVALCILWQVLRACPCLHLV